MWNYLLRCVVFLLLTLVLFIVTIPLIIWRIIVCILIWISGEDLEIVEPSDAFHAFYHPTNPKHRQFLRGVMIYEGETTLKELQKHFWNVVFQKGKGKFSRIPVSRYGYYFWQKIGCDFNINDHVMYAPCVKDINTPVTEEQVLETISHLRPQKTGVPLLFLYYVPKFVPKRKEHQSINNQFVLMAYYHHMVCDGMSFIKSIFSDNVPENQHIKTPEVPLVVKITGTIRALWAAAGILSEKSQYKLSEFQNAMFRQERLKNVNFTASSDEVDISVFKKIKSLTGAPISATALTALSETFAYTLKKYDAENGRKYDTKIVSYNISVPAISAHPLDYSFKNRATVRNYHLPVDDQMDVLTKLEVVKKDYMNRNYQENAKGLYFAGIIFFFIPKYFLEIEDVSNQEDSCTGFGTVFTGLPDNYFLMRKYRMCRLLTIMEIGRAYTGIGTSIGNVGNAFQLTILADEACIPSQKEVQAFADRWHHNVMKILTEAKRCCINNNNVK